jgi:hypothetical protein
LLLTLSQAETTELLNNLKKEENKDKKKEILLDAIRNK